MADEARQDNTDRAPAAPVERGSYPAEQCPVTPPQQDQSQPMPQCTDVTAGCQTHPMDPHVQLGNDSATHDVLVVEDDPEINELIGAYVELAGYPCRRVGCGNDALTTAHDHPPSLVVLDVMLPDLDGFEICRRLRSDPRTCTVPIVMLTALDQEDMRRRASLCGATEYMTKPFDPDRLLNTIQQRMNHRGTNGAH